VKDLKLEKDVAPYFRSIAHSECVARTAAGRDCGGACGGDALCGAALPWRRPCHAVRRNDDDNRVRGRSCRRRRGAVTRWATAVFELSFAPALRTSAPLTPVSSPAAAAAVAAHYNPRTDRLIITADKYEDAALNKRLALEQLIGSVVEVRARRIKQSQRAQVASPAAELSPPSNAPPRRVFPKYDQF